MSKNETVVIATAAAAGVAIVTVNYVKTLRTERAKRRDIQLKLERDVAAIKRASAVVQEKIARGDYDHNLPIIPTILNDLDFYTMVDHFED